MLEQNIMLVMNFKGKLVDLKFKLKLYNMSKLIDTYIAGGVEYMHPITLLFLFNIGIAGYIIFCRIRKKIFHNAWLEAIKHVAGFIVAFGTFGTLAGFFMAFNALENSEQIIPFQMIMGGLKVALINVLYGLVIFFISMLVYVVLKLRKAA